MAGFGLSHFIRNWTTKQWESWWKRRKIDWKAAYVDTWNHPHRQMIAEALRGIQWISLWEIGCGSGANLIQLHKQYPDRQVGGNDINPDAIAMCKTIFQGAMFEVCPNDDIMGSDDFTDIVLSDRTLMYTSWGKITKQINELKRITRVGVMIVEYDTTDWWDKLKLFLSSGLYAHDYEKLLQKAGFYDIVKLKLPSQEDSDINQKKLLHLIYGKR